MKKLLALFLLLFAATANAGIVYQNGSVLYASDLNGFVQLSDLSNTTNSSLGVALVGRAMSLDTAQTITGAKTFSGTIGGAGLSALFASPPPTGITAPASGAFTSLSASGAVTGIGFSTYLASPPAIGSTAPASGAFTTLSASTVNKITLTAPATGSTLTIADGKTLTASNTLTISGTDGSSVNVGAGGTMVSTATLNSGTLPASFSSVTITSLNSTPVGNTTPSTGAFTTLSASGATTVQNATLANQPVALGQFVPTLSTTGGFTFPGGLIMKWGVIPAVTTTVTFATPFPNAVLSVQCTPNNTADIAVANPPLSYGVSTTGFTVDPVAGSTTKYPCYWLVIGY